VRTQLDVLNVEQQLATTTRDLIQARYLYLMSRLRLHALSGHDQASGCNWESNVAQFPSFSWT
jgi:outer membrane protein/protease secretion system outer membrane protein